MECIVQIQISATARYTGGVRSAKSFPPHACGCLKLQLIHLLLVCCGSVISNDHRFPRIVFERSLGPITLAKNLPGQ
jgi:hypothetical protein